MSADVKRYTRRLEMNTNEKTKNIYQRINAVMSEVQYVQKDKQVSGAGANYKAVTHDQVVSVIRESLVKHGIVIFPEQKTNDMPIMRDVEKNIKMHLYSAEYVIHFVNIDNGEDRISVSINAHANDNGDKAPGKAVTYATKTAMLKVFCLETGDDEESRAEVRNTIDEGEQSVLAGMINGDQSVWQKVCAAYNISHLAQIPKTKFSEVKGRLEKLNGVKNANNS